ncbi:WD40 repeat domain 95 [Nowakowskiella sp. JEL0407]|nr:WD40 repeat domain 95 [Nowakowskiella sp. JEL0407]
MADEIYNSSVVPVDEEELERFRQSWANELGSNHTKSQASSSTQIPPIQSPPVVLGSSSRATSASRIFNFKDDDNSVTFEKQIETVSSSMKTLDISDNGQELPKAVALFHKATNYERMGNLSEALKLYREASRLDNDIEFTFRKNWQHKLNTTQDHQDESNDSFFNYYLFAPSSTQSHNVSTLDDLAKSISEFNPQLVPKSPTSKKNWMHKLPFELIGRIIQWTLLRDTSTLCSISLVCRRYFMLTRDRTVWKFLCEQLHDTRAMEIEYRSRAPKDWFEVFLDKPRVRKDGLYISRVNYTRQGFAEASYRFLRFLPDTQQCILWTTTVEPRDAVKQIQDPVIVYQKRLKGVMFGNYKFLSPTKVSLEFTDPERPGMNFKASLELSSTKRGLHNKLTWIEYHCTHFRSRGNNNKKAGKGKKDVSTSDEGFEEVINEIPVRNNDRGDVQQHMNLHHFEELMKLFHEHKREDGATGFDIDMFREVFGKVLGGNLSFDQMTQLFMKIDANSDGTVDWDEFSTYMMSGTMEADNLSHVFDERIRKLVNCPHKDMIKKIEFIPRERKYISVGRDGTTCLWAPNLKLQRTINTTELNPKQSWIADAAYMHDQSKLALITDDRQLCIYDVLSIKPRLLVSISQLDSNPLCIAIAPQYEEERDLILFGDDGGYINVVTISRKFLSENSGDVEMESLTPAKLLKKDAVKKNYITFYRRKIHNDWVLKIQYYPDMNAFVSCATENTRSLVIGDLERKTVRFINVPKGIKCFDFCKRPSFLVTGGRDKIVRLWNPYVLSKPAGSLYGHNATIMNILVNHEEGHVISLSEDKVIKIWNARNLNCLQTLVDKIPHRPENIISSIYFDYNNHQLISGSNKLESWPLYKNTKHAVARSHYAPIVAAMYNSNFHQIVSGCQNGTISIWHLVTGEKYFQFNNAHEKYELTAMCYDKSGRRLITGGRNGILKMWNFNNGQILRKFKKEEASEITNVEYVEMGSNKYVIAVGWDRKISVFLEDSSHFEHLPVRVFNGSGTTAHKGHMDDITSLAFCPPNILATGSADGVIVSWNLESGYIKATMKEPFLDFRGKDEKAIEKLLFLFDEKTSKTKNYRAPLVSCHADGHLRYWEPHYGYLLYEANLQLHEWEGLTCMSTDTQLTTMLIGGSSGHIRILDLETDNLGSNENQPYKQPFSLRLVWRAHVQSITSVSFVPNHEIVVTASLDSTVRLWTIKGAHIGVLGQEELWNIADTKTFKPTPADVVHETQMEEQRNQLLTLQQEYMKKNVTVKASQKVLKKKEGEDDQRVIAIQSQIIKRWKEYVEKKKSSESWTVSPELMKLKNKRLFFSLQTPKTMNHVKNIRVKHEAVYRLLECHSLEEVPSSLPALVKSRNIKVDGLRSNYSQIPAKKERILPIAAFPGRVK